MYSKYIKRPLDFLLSLCAIIALSPIFLILTIVGAIKMKGNPFFTQLRPGKDEKIFRLIKFRTMTCEKDSKGNLLPDRERLVPYGKLLRSLSLDEIPQLFNVLLGDMSLIGPRPLLPRYLPYYTEREQLRHSVRPGITGWAQVNGRNALDWDAKLEYDAYYAEHISLIFDLKILLLTAYKVIKREGTIPDKLENYLDVERSQKLSFSK